MVSSESRRRIRSRSARAPLDDQHADRAALPGQPVQPLVMEDHRLPVAARLHVQLDAVAGLDRGLEGGAAVLDAALPVQPAMREGPRRQPAKLSLP